MLILKTLALEPMHGYGIGVRLEQISKGVFQVNAGSLFPALRRLERDGLIAGDWQTTENNRQREVLQAHSDWTRTAQAGSARLGSADLGHHAHSEGLSRGIVMTRWLMGLRALIFKRRTERELDAELREYLNTAIEQKMSSGMSRADATRAARVEMGSVEAVKDHVRDAGWETTVESVWRDARYGLRLLRTIAGLHGGHGHHTRPWHRRQHGGLFRRVRGALPVTAVSGSSAARRDRSRTKEPAIDRGADFPSHIPRLAGSKPLLRIAGRVCGRPVRADGPRRCRRAHYGCRDAEHLFVAGRHAARGQNAAVGGRRPQRRARDRDQRAVLARPPRCKARRRRSASDAGRYALRHRRRHASNLSVPALEPCRASVDAAEAVPAVRANPAGPGGSVPVRGWAAPGPVTTCSRRPPKCKRSAARLAQQHSGRRAIRSFRSSVCRNACWATRNPPSCCSSAPSPCCS